MTLSCGGIHFQADKYSLHAHHKLFLKGGIGLLGTDIIHELNLNGDTICTGIYNVKVQHCGTGSQAGMQFKITIF